MRKAFVYLILFIIIVFGSILYYKNQQNQKIEDNYTRDNVIDEVINRPKETINAKYQFKDGRHTLLGTLQLPTPCHNFEVNVIENDSETELSIKISSSQDVCIQQITEKTFKVSFEGDEDMLIVALLNGEVVNFNLFEVPKDEDINNVKIDYKG